MNSTTIMRALRHYGLVLSSAAIVSLNAPPSVAQPPTTQPASRPSTTRISFNFKDTSVDAVLDYLSDVAGFVVVKEATVSGRVTILSKQPVTPEEAVSLLNTVLKTNGLTAIQMGRVLKITALVNAKKQNIPVHFGADPSQIAPSDELITQVIPVRSVDAVKLKQDLQPLISADADFAANGGSNTIIITDTAANIRRVVEIIANLDKSQAAENTIRVRQLKYADATAAAKLITDIFAPQQQSTQTNFPGPFQFFRNFAPGGGGFGGGGGGGGGGAAARAAAAAAAAQGQQDTARTGKVVASADTRTNTVVVSGPVDILAVVDQMLTQLDANPAAEQTFFIYAVKNGQAVEMQNTLNSLFTLTSTSTGTTNNRTQYGTTGNLISNNNRTGGLGGGLGTGGGFGGGGLGGGGLGTSNTGINRGTSSSAATSSLNRGISGATGAAGVSQAAIADLVGQVYVVADQDTNSLLVATATRYEKQVRDLIAVLDRPVPQVLIKVLIAEVTHDNSLDMGVDFSVLDQRASGNGQKFSGTLGAAAAAVSATAPPGMVVSLLESNLTSTIQALAQANKLDVLSRPYILTSDNQQAYINVGSEVPFITDSYVDTNGGTHNTVQYQSIGITLSVTPHVNPEGLVVMDVSPSITSLTAQTVTIQPGVDAPVFEQRLADAYVSIKDGQTIVIGGLMQDQKTASVNKIPILGDIPLLGKLFQYSTNDKSKTELLIFLTPHVAMAPESLTKMSQDEAKGLKLTPSAVQPGVMQEHIQGMARGSATQPSHPLELPPPTPQGSSLSEPPMPGEHQK